MELICDQCNSVWEDWLQMYGPLITPQIKKFLLHCSRAWGFPDHWYRILPHTLTEIHIDYTNNNMFPFPLNDVSVYFPDLEELTLSIDEFPYASEHLSILALPLHDILHYHDARISEQCYSFLKKKLDPEEIEYYFVQNVQNMNIITNAKKYLSQLRPHAAQKRTGLFPCLKRFTWCGLYYHPREIAGVNWIDYVKNWWFWKATGLHKRITRIEFNKEDIVIHFI